MKNLFNYRWIRALYQIVVVGIFLLPFRLLILALSALEILMLPAQGISVSDGFKELFAGIVIGYRSRAYWVKTGNVLS